MRRYPVGALAVAALLMLAASCDQPVIIAPSTPTEAAPAPLVDVTLELRPSEAVIRVGQRETILCLSIPEPPEYTWAPPGAMHTICQPAQGWMEDVRVANLWRAGR